MIAFDGQTLNALDWQAVLAQVASCCDTAYGASLWQEQPFLPERADVAAHLSWVAALSQAIHPDTALSQCDPEALSIEARPFLVRLHKGDVLDGPDLVKLALHLKALSGWCRNLARRIPADLIQDESNPYSGRVMYGLRASDGFLAVAEAIAALLDEWGQVREDADPQLVTMRSEARELRHNIQQRLNTLMRERADAIQEAVVTERDGRFVIPVKVSHRAAIEGITHDVSSSGATQFVEPQAVVTLNNRLRTVESHEAHLCQKLISELCRRLAPLVEENLFPAVGAIAWLDRLLASARYGQRVRGHVPVLADDHSTLLLEDLHHPLLSTAMGGKTVANTVAFDAGTRALVISGPNMGGKTVLLKAVGLSLLMAHAGLPLPVGEGSVISLFYPVVAIIGDHQNLLADLSTFAAHLKAMMPLLQEDIRLDRALVLIDEIGTGTDPEEGAALACAVIDTLLDKGATTLVTTHSAALKVAAHQRPGCTNARMGLDPETLQPNFRLTIGMPGASHALRLARHLGMPAHVLDAARQYMDEPTRRLNTLLEEAETHQHEASRRLEAAHSAKQEAEQTRYLWQTAVDRLEREKREMLSKYRTRIGNSLSQLEEASAQAAADSQKRRQGGRSLAENAQRLRQRAQQVEEALQQLEQDQWLPTQEPKVGETYRSRGLNVTGTVVEVNSESRRANLSFGQMSASVPFEDLEPLSRGAISHARQLPPAAALASLSGSGGRRQVDGFPTFDAAALEDAPMTTALDGPAATELDLRGMRIPEAIELMAHFLEQATAAQRQGRLNADTLAVWHGEGKGVLRRVVRGYLAEAPQVSRYEPASEEEGGEGKTLVWLQPAIQPAESL